MSDLLEELVAPEQPSLACSIVLPAATLPDRRLHVSSVRVNCALLCSAEVTQHWLGVDQPGLVLTPISILGFLAMIAGKYVVRYQMSTNSGLTPLRCLVRIEYARKSAIVGSS